MSAMRRRCLTLSLLALSPAFAAAQSMPELSIAPASVVEGDTGTSPMTFRVTRSAPTDVDVQVYVILDDDTATPGLDYVDNTPIDVVIDDTETFVDVEVPIVGDLVPEADEWFTARLQDPVGATLAPGASEARGDIVDDEPLADPPYAAIDDRFVVAENTTMAMLEVLENDILFGAADGTLTLLTNPAHGTATLRNDIAPQYVEYRPTADFSGSDGFLYRYCTSGDDCDVGQVRIVLRPLVDPTITTPVASGAMDFLVSDLRALPSARFVATPLVAPSTLGFDNSVDPTPQSPWDSPAGVTWDVRTLAAPAPGETLTRLIVDEPVGRGQELIVGLDANDDGQPSPAEAACSSAHGTARCEVAVPRNAGESVNYWVLVHNLRDESTDGVVQIYRVPMVPPDGSLQSTGAGHTERLENFELLLGWVDDTLQDDDARAGYVTVWSDAATVVGEFPVFVRLSTPTAVVRTPVPLIDGRPHAFALEPGEYHRYTIIDIPAGSTRLRAVSQSDQDIDLFLVPMTTAVDPADTDIDISPPVASALAQATGPSGNEQVEVAAAVINAGRWYIVAYNDSGVRAEYTLTATVDATNPPVVRDGSYFNPDRSGSGVFLYPAGNQWTGLWYTYDRDGLPTWYYLQALQPGADGLWTSGIYRSMWDGDSNVLTSVGDLTITPNGADRFQMTYRIDGVAGTQPMEEFGRGCPMNGAIDLSGTWFDPDRAGSGYSVQLFPAYEYYAAYYYDDLGYARFVAAELPTYGGSEAELVIQQLFGDCPTCDYDGAPVRTDIGLLTRRVLSGSFQYIATDLEFDPPLSGGWTVTDMVQLLGGPGTTQGCDL